MIFDLFNLNMFTNTKNLKTVIQNQNAGILDIFIKEKFTK